MNVLITNQSLEKRAGTELYTWEITAILRERGHRPFAYTSRLGQVSDLMEYHHIPVITEIRDLDVRPDIIHGQHHLDAMTALLALPGVPAIYFCHGAVPWQEQPPRHPRIRRYATTSPHLSERLAVEKQIPFENCRVFPNHVDLDRFCPRDERPAKPARALVFIPNLQGEERLATIRRACESQGVSVEFGGHSVGNPIANPDEVLPTYDIVFATGRSALEAVACGCGVILMDTHRVGKFVTMENYQHSRDMNFALSRILPPMTETRIAEQIARYDAGEIRRVTEKLRSEAGLEDAAERLEALYAEVLEEWNALDPKPTAEEEAAATGEYFRWLTSLVRHAEAQRPLEESDRMWREEREKRRRLQKKTRIARTKLRMVQDAFSENPMLRMVGREVRKQWRTVGE